MGTQHAVLVNVDVLISTLGLVTLRDKKVIIVLCWRCHRRQVVKSCKEWLAIFVDVISLEVVVDFLSHDIDGMIRDKIIPLLQQAQLIGSDVSHVISSILLAAHLYDAARPVSDRILDQDISYCFLQVCHT